MDYRTLGKTGLRVSRIGFGGAVLGFKNYLGTYDPEKPEDRAVAIRAIHAAVDAGITFFDTAPGYGDGLSESILGEGLAGRDVQIATKYGPWQQKKLCVEDSLERSLQLLQRDQVEVLWLHGTVFWPEETDAILAEGGLLSHMEALRDAGKVQHLGFTAEVPNEAVDRLIRSGRFACCQLNYSVTHQSMHDPRRQAGAMQLAAWEGMGIATMRTTTQGILQRWLQLVAPDFKQDLTAAAIQYVLSDDLVDLALIGMPSPALVEANCRLVDDTAGRIDLKKLYDPFC
jgi:uncharacterized protein